MDHDRTGPLSVAQAKARLLVLSEPSPDSGAGVQLPGLGSFRISTPLLATGGALVAGLVLSRNRMIRTLILRGAGIGARAATAVAVAKASQLVREPHGTPHPRGPTAPPR